MKKSLSLLLVVILLVLSLASCGSDKLDPTTVAKKLQEDYSLKISADEYDIEYFTDETNASYKGIEGMVAIDPTSDYDEKGALMIFCENNKIAKALAKDLKDYTEKMTEDDYIYFKRALVKRAGKVVFFGYEDIWEEIK